MLLSTMWSSVRGWGYSSASPPTAPDDEADGAAHPSSLSPSLPHPYDYAVVSQLTPLQAPADSASHDLPPPPLLSLTPTRSPVRSASSLPSASRSTVTKSAPAPSFEETDAEADPSVVSALPPSHPLLTGQSHAHSVSTPAFAARSAMQSSAPAGLFASSPVVWVDEPSSDECGVVRVASSTSLSSSSASSPSSFFPPPSYRLVQRDRRREKRRWQGAMPMSASLSSILIDTVSPSKSSRSNREPHPRVRRSAGQRFMTSVEHLARRRAIDSASTMDESSSSLPVHTCTNATCAACSTVSDAALRDSPPLRCLSDDDGEIGKAVLSLAQLSSLSSSMSLSSVPSVVSVSSSPLKSPSEYHVISIVPERAEQEGLTLSDAQPGLPSSVLLDSELPSSSLSSTCWSSWSSLGSALLVVGVGYAGVAAAFLWALLSYGPLMASPPPTLYFVLPIVLGLMAVCACALSCRSCTATPGARLAAASTLLAAANNAVAGGLLVYACYSLLAEEYEAASRALSDPLALSSASHSAHQALAAVALLCAIALLIAVFALSRVQSASAALAAALTHRGRGASMRRTGAGEERSAERYAQRRKERREREEKRRNDARTSRITPNNAAQRTR